MNDNDWFIQQFESLTHYSPYPWQINLFNRFVEGIIPSNISLPTGVGKTNAIVVWLLARIKNPSLPRRLVYVVDRRSVVDQATKVVEEIVANLSHAVKDALADFTLPDESLLGVSSLRGEFEDNEEWSKMPFRPSVLVGTVDKVGSALMFSSYGDGCYRRPLIAGLLGNDTLLIFDECHLVPAFETLLRNIDKAGGKLKQFRAMTMSATSSGDDFTLTPEDLENETLGQRLNAAKTLQLLNTPQVVNSIVKLARENPPRRTIIFVNSPRTAVEITESLSANFKKVISLTGTIRGKERDDLLDNPVFQAFMVPQSPVEPHFLVATSAGEVGIDLTCDRMITDMTKAASFVQRAGRVNRFGESENAEIRVVFKQFDVEKFEQEVDLKFIRDLKGDASCAALYARREQLAAITRRPSVIPSLEPAVLDVLSMTSLKHSVNVGEYLRGKAVSSHGVEVAWRIEVPLLAQMSAHEFESYMKHMRVLSFERLNETEKRVLEVLAELDPSTEVIVVNAAGERHVTTIVAINREDLTNGLLILPPNAGGLASGMLSSSNADGTVLDIACIKHKHHEARARILCAADAVPALAEDEKELFNKEIAGQVLIVRKVKDRKRAVTVFLNAHSDEVRVMARMFAERAGLDAELIAALELAGEMHDIGKANPIWQVAARGSTKGEAIAKGGMRFNPNALNGYRHEFESMAQTENELAKHLVGSHHAGARPSWTGERTLAPVNRDQDAVLTQINRFAVLQGRFGWWGLAYLDAMMKCADAYVSEE